MLYAFVDIQPKATSNTEDLLAAAAEGDLETVLQMVAQRGDLVNCADEVRQMCACTAFKHVTSTRV
jgi:hypothetical protein